MKTRILAFLLVLASCAVPVPAQAKEVLVITGDSSTLDYRENTLLVEGHARLEFKDVRGSCDRIRYLIKEGVVELVQNVVIIRGSNKLTGKVARYYVKESRIVVEDQATLIFTPEPREEKK